MAAEVGLTRGSSRGLSQEEDLPGASLPVIDAQFFRRALPPPPGSSPLGKPASTKETPPDSRHEDSRAAPSAKTSVPKEEPDPDPDHEGLSMKAVMKWWEQNDPRAGAASGEELRPTSPSGTAARKTQPLSSKNVSSFQRSSTASAKSGSTRQHSRAYVPDSAHMRNPSEYFSEWEKAFAAETDAKVEEEPPATGLKTHRVSQSVSSSGSSSGSSRPSGQRAASPSNGAGHHRRKLTATVWQGGKQIN